MARTSQYVAVYDVSEDRERERVAQVLEGFGLRVQYSAFELRLTPATRQTLLRRLEALQLRTGFLYLYRRAAGHDRKGVGEMPDDPLAEERHAFILVGDGRAQPASRRRRKFVDPLSEPSALPMPLVNGVLPADFALGSSAKTEASS